MKSIKTSIRSTTTSRLHKLNLILEFDEDCTTAEAIEYLQNALRYYDDRQEGE